MRRRSPAQRPSSPHPLLVLLHGSGEGSSRRDESYGWPRPNRRHVSGGAARLARGSGIRTRCSLGSASCSASRGSLWSSNQKVATTRSTRTSRAHVMLAKSKTQVMENDEALTTWSRQFKEQLPDAVKAEIIAEARDESLGDQTVTAEVMKRIAEMLKRLHQKYRRPAPAAACELRVWCRAPDPDGRLERELPLGLGSTQRVPAVTRCSACSMTTVRRLSPPRIFLSTSMWSGSRRHGSTSRRSSVDTT